MSRTRQDNRFAKRVDSVDWTAVRTELEQLGCALTGQLLTPDEAAQIAAVYPDDSRFRSTVNMSRHRFGQGEYRYFKEPFPDAVTALKQALYPRLLPIARDWWTKLGRPAPWPDTLDEWLEMCHAAGQTKSTPILLKYGQGDWNALHRDLYGDVFFPFQVLTVLSRRGIDFEGGEFVLLEQRPRAQSRAHVLTPPPGSFVIFPTSERPQRGVHGHHRVGLRHGVSTVTAGRRTALGVIFHDAR